jgi:predicted nucleic acid-binding protein
VGKIHLIYLDSAVWVSYMLADRHKDKADVLFKRALQDGNKIIVSTLNLLEVVEVIRKRIAEDTKFIGLADMYTQIVANKITAASRLFIQKILDLAQQGHLLIIDPLTDLHDYFTSTLQLLIVNFGVIAKSDYCFICDRQTRPRYRYIGVGPHDLQHIINAKECSANEFVTFDKGFLRLKTLFADNDGLTITVQ